MRIEIPISPDEPKGYFPLQISVSLTAEDALKLERIRCGLHEAGCRHSENCTIDSVEDAITLMIQSAVAEDASPTAEQPPVDDRVPRSTEPA